MSINDELLDKLDKLLLVKGFSTRSEIIREALRNYITTEVWEKEKGPLVVTGTVSYTHLRAHETVLDLVCRLLLEKKKQQKINNIKGS